jgi:hypothetical protein
MFVASSVRTELDALFLLAKIRPLFIIFIIRKFEEFFTKNYSFILNVHHLKRCLFQGNPVEKQQAVEANKSAFTCTSKIAIRK